MCYKMTKKKVRTYSEEFKLSVIRDYYSSGLSRYACTKKFGLTSPSMLTSWLRKYGSDENLLSLPGEQDTDTMARSSMESYRDEATRLKRRVRELEKALEFSRLETRARDMMIDRAEELFNIPIRKKSGAK